MAEFAALWPLKRFPVLADGNRTVIESSIIIEYLARHHPGPVRLIPADADAALEARSMDRSFDQYVSTPQGRIVFNALRAETDRDPCGMAEARGMLDTAYAWLDGVMAGRPWAAGKDFSLAELRRRAGAVLRRLAAPDSGAIRPPEGVSPAPAGPADPGTFIMFGCAIVGLLICCSRQSRKPLEHGVVTKDSKPAIQRCSLPDQYRCSPSSEARATQSALN